MKTIVFQCPYIVWKFETPNRFSPVKENGKFLNKTLKKKNTYLDQLNLKMPLAVLLYKEVKNCHFMTWFRFYCGWKAVNCSFLGGGDWGFLKDGGQTHLMAPTPPLNSLLFNSNNSILLYNYYWEDFLIDTSIGEKSQNPSWIRATIQMF
jgi:hypothetical protein